MESELVNKINQGLKKYKLDGLIISGWDNITYLTGAMLPFAPDYPTRKAVLVYSPSECRLFAPVDWIEFVEQQKWQGHMTVLNESCSAEELGAKLSDALKGSALAAGRLGIDCAKTSQEVYLQIGKLLPDAELISADDLMRELRIVKTASEIKKLERAARYSELGIVATLNHTEGTIDAVSFGRSEAAERMRVHIAEFGGAATGNFVGLQHDDMTRIYGLNHDSLDEGLIRYDITSEFEGYWNSAGRTVYICKATPEAKKAYRDNLTIKAYALSLLKPGARCCDIFRKVSVKASELGIAAVSELGFGYGVGCSEREYPYLTSEDDTELAENMVIALDVFTYGPAKELIHSIDTYRITKDGTEKLSWYRDYDRLYEIVGITARHG